MIDFIYFSLASGRQEEQTGQRERDEKVKERAKRREKKQERKSEDEGNNLKSREE